MTMHRLFMTLPGLRGLHVFVALHSFLSSCLASAEPVLPFVVLHMSVIYRALIPNWQRPLVTCGADILRAVGSAVVCPFDAES